MDHILSSIPYYQASAKRLCDIAILGEMRLILHSNSFYIFGAVILVGFALTLLFTTLSGQKVERVTTFVERGDVLEIVSVSGVVEAKQTAKLAFPVSGIVTTVFAEEGASVESGAVLATLASAELVAERLDALAALQTAEADQAELIAGPRAEARAVTTQTIRNAEQNLSKITNETNERVENAKRTLLSSSLISRAKESDETATAPTVSGTYTCDTEGTYQITTYNADTFTDFSYRVTGLESGNYRAFFQSPGAMGTCGLFLQFDPDTLYRDSVWLIDIPNKQSAVYQTNLNAYTLAVIEQQEAIRAAENSLALAKEEASLSNADPRSEELARKNAAVTQARARIQAIDARIADRSIVAPFSGVITDVDILPGETAGANPVITLLANNSFELTARIPEIDITKIIPDQPVEVIFDAASNTVLSGRVSFISPLATEIDGVAYFKATIVLDDTPTWMRSGLNADINIIAERSEDVLRIPKRFLIKTEAGASVLIPQANSDSVIPVPIEVIFTGNDGFVEITGVTEGDTIVAP